MLHDDPECWTQIDAWFWLKTAQVAKALSRHAWGSWATTTQPESDVVWNFVSNIYEKQGKRDDVVRLTLEGKTDRDLSREDVASLQRAYVRDGWAGYWTRWLQLHAPANDPSLDAYKIAVAEARLGHAKNTWAWMETCADRRDVWTTWITVDPMFDEVRSDPAYVQLLRRVHLGN